MNERCTEFIYNQMSKEQRENLSAPGKLGVTLTSGVVAGFAAAIFSHVRQNPNSLILSYAQPADSLLSQINKGHGPKGSMLYRLYPLQSRWDRQVC